jgi:hypothetical protein
MAQMDKEGNLDKYFSLLKKAAENGWVNKENKKITYPDLLDKNKQFSLPPSIHSFIMQNFVHLSANYNNPFINAIDHLDLAILIFILKTMKNLKTLLMKDKITLLIWTLAISLSTTLISCYKEPNKFQWQHGISAPKFYPIGGVSVDFNVAGNGSLTNFDNGWGDQYGSVVSGDKYKEVPKEVHIKYYSTVDNLEYKGTVNLPQKNS